MKRLLVFICVVIALVFSLVGCSSDSDQNLPNVTRPIHTTDLRLVKGQTVYVPAYSEMFAGDERTLKLTVTLAIHNSDPTQSIVLRTVQYYDTNGELVREYLDEPVEIGPLSTMGYIVAEQDTRGGWGANFLVEWGAEQEVYEPVIEAVMIGAGFGYSISLISPGRVVSQNVGAGG